MNKRRFIPQFLAVFLACAAMLPLLPAAFAEETTLMIPFILTVYEGDRAGGIRAYHANYRNNIYLSLSDLSAFLDGTSKQFSIAYGKTQQDGEYHTLRLGEAYLTENSGITPTPYEEREDVWLVYKRYRLFVNGAERKIYTYREGGYDLFMSLPDLQMVLDLTIEKVSSESIRILTDKPFSPDYASLASEGYFDDLQSFAVGDAATGALFYAHELSRPVSIASTSKLMTYLLAAEAIRRGELSLDSTIPLSAQAERVSKSADGIIPMEAGQTVTVSELLDAMLVASSNESAVALAECVAGSVENFVTRMNQRAQELGLTSAVFYSPDGLPVYTDSAIPAKRQNHMSARDLFVLSAYVISNYPAVTERTSRTYVTLPSLKYTTANSNPLVFNLPGVNGLKTGSTNRAGYCLVASMPVTVDGETHPLLLVLLGAENAAERGQAAELLLRCAAAEIRKVGFLK